MGISSKHSLSLRPCSAPSHLKNKCTETELVSTPSGQADSWVLLERVTVLQLCVLYVQWLIVYWVPPNPIPLWLQKTVKGKDAASVFWIFHLSTLHTAYGQKAFGPTAALINTRSTEAAASPCVGRCVTFHLATHWAHYSLHWHWTLAYNIICEVQNPPI